MNGTATASVTAHFSNYIHAMNILAPTEGKRPPKKFKQMEQMELLKKDK